jgi:catechol 2,3-dioxygenase-like lactoylglutathione lyase family enzyme
MIVFGDVAIVVSDTGAAKRFWTEKLGFELRDDMGHWVTVAPMGASTVIHLCQNGTREEGNTGIGFEVPDVRALYETWRAKGVAFPTPPTDTQWGTVVAHFADPDGNTFQLSEDPELRKPRKKAAKKAAKKAKKPAKKAKKAGKKARR